MQKKITVHTVTSGTITIAYLSKGEAEKAKQVLEQFSLTAEIGTEKRTATISAV